MDRSKTMITLAGVLLPHFEHRNEKRYSLNEKSFPQFKQSGWVNLRLIGKTSAR